MSATTHLAYISKLRLLDGFYGAEILLPLADVDLDTSFGPKDRERGVGDLIVSPLILQWTDHKLFGMPYFHRFVFSVTLPTGKYDRNRPVNIGSNMVSINPYYAFTIMPADKLELSARLHYLWNSENDDPFAGLGAGPFSRDRPFTPTMPLRTSSSKACDSALTAMHCSNSPRTRLMAAARPIQKNAFSASGRASSGVATGYRFISTATLRLEQKIGQKEPRWFFGFPRYFKNLTDRQA